LLGRNSTTLSHIPNPFCFIIFWIVSQVLQWVGLWLWPSCLPTPSA
jgi:hypothetical protein